jgi:hypothetical protein
MNVWKQMVAGVSAHFLQQYGDHTTLTTDAAALNGLSSLSDGQSMHFPQNSGI